MTHENKTDIINAFETYVKKVYSNQKWDYGFDDYDTCFNVEITTEDGMLFNLTFDYNYDFYNTFEKKVFEEIEIDFFDSCETLQEVMNYIKKYKKTFSFLYNLSLTNKNQ